MLHILFRLIIMPKIKILDAAKIGSQNKITLKATIMDVLNLSPGDLVVFECELDGNKKSKIYIRGDVSE